MSSLSSLTPAQLRRAAEIQEQIEALSSELAAVLNGSSVSVPQSAPEIEPVKARKKYKLSAAGRAAKIAAQKARWAKVEAGKSEAEPEKKRRKMSTSAKAKIAAAAKARWAKVRAGKAGNV